MSVSSLRWYERGWRKIGKRWAPVRPTEGALRSLAVALEVPLDDLAERCESNVSPVKRRTAALRLAAVFPSSQGDPFWGQILEGLRLELPPPWVVMTFLTADDSDMERLVLEQIGQIGADALVVAPAINGRWPDSPINRRKIPIVVLDRIPDGPVPDHVEVLAAEHRTAVMVATRRLLRSGRVERLACLAGPSALSSSRERFGAVKDVLGLYRSDLLEKDRSGWAPVMEKGDVRTAEAVMNQLLLLPPSESPDGVICLNGEMTIGALRAIQSQGLTIPKDIRFVGYDDGLWGWGLSCVEPPPSLIRQDSTQIGREAARCVIGWRDSAPSDHGLHIAPARFEPYVGGLPTCDVPSVVT